MNHAETEPAWVSEGVDEMRPWTGPAQRLSLHRECVRKAEGWGESEAGQVLSYC